MNEHQRLLDEARRFCNPETGEVIELIPEELMRPLRAAKMAVGIWGEASQTATTAKWYVFLDDQIRDQVVKQWREVNRKRQRARKRRVEPDQQPPTSDVESPAKTLSGRGLRGFVRPRKPDVS
ncbi:MAG: hypothetical protein ACYC0X_16445 [Pirellulaceae bacterium]